MRVTKIMTATLFNETTVNHLTRLQEAFYEDMQRRNDPETQNG